MTQTEPAPTQTEPAAAPIDEISKPVIPARSLLLMGVAAACFAAWLPDVEGPGIFLVIVALLAGGAIFASGKAERKPLNYLFAGAGLVLIATTTIRNTEITGPFNILFGLIFAALALSAPTTWAQALLATFAPSSRLPYVPGTLVRSTAALAKSSNPQKAVALLRGVLLGGFLVAVFWGLFASADRAFAHLTDRLFPDWDLGLLPLRFFIFLFTAAGIAAFVLTSLRGAPGWLKNLVDQVEKLPFRLGRLEWMIALSLLNLLFLVFAILQVVVLFQGHAHILETAGLTYAEYAREGFFQLLFAAALAIPVVAFTWTHSKRSTPADTKVMKVLLGALCLLTLVVVGSALRRLGLYEEAFGFTGDRLTAHVFALWLGAVFLAMVIAGAIGHTRHLFLATAALTAGALIAFSAINPEAAIARRNLERYEEIGKIDTDYLSNLSSDAVPVLLEAPGPLSETFRSNFEKKVPESEPWSSANLSRIRARNLLNP